MRLHLRTVPPIRHIQGLSSSLLGSRGNCYLVLVSAVVPSFCPSIPVSHSQIPFDLVLAKHITHVPSESAGLLHALRCFNSTQYTILRALVRYHPPGIVEPCRMSLERYHLILCSMYAPSELNEQFWHQHLAFGFGGSPTLFSLASRLWLKTEGRPLTLIIASTS